MLLIATSRANRDIAECLVRELVIIAETLYGMDGPEDPYITIEPIRIRLIDPGVVRDKLDKALSSNYERGHVVAVIHNLSYMPLETVGILHFYIDHTSLRYQNTILLATVYIEQNIIPSCKTDVAAYLLDNWEEIEKDILNPLMRIVANSIVIMVTKEVGEFCKK